MRSLNKRIWKYTVRLVNSVSISDIDLWCSKSTGKRFYDWFSYVEFEEFVFAFTSKEDATIFKLKWGNYEIK